MDEEIIYRAVVRALARVFNDEKIEKTETPEKSTTSRADYDTTVDDAVKKYNRITKEAFTAYGNVLATAKIEYEKEVSQIRDAFYTRNRNKINSTFKGGHNGKETN